MKMDGYIIGIGAANVDLCGRSSTPLVMEDSNPGVFVSSVGGVTRNICENAARMGAGVKLITTLGDDVYAGMIRSQCAGCGVDLSHAVVLPNSSSSVYMSIHDQNGEMALALSDMSILQRLEPRHLEERAEVIEGASAIIMDGGLPQDVINCVPERWGAKIPVFIDPVSTAYARKFCGWLTGCHTIKPNALEAATLTGVEVRDKESADKAAKRLLEMGAQRAVITMGASGAYYLERGGMGKLYPAQPLPGEAANATGAGDCLTGALLYGFLRGFEPDKLMHFAMLAASLTLTSPWTIHPKLGERLKQLGAYNNRQPV